MASNKNSSSNRVEVPEARDAGSIGGEMVRKMIKRQEEEMAGQSR